ncbi:hypothetical protein D3C80_1179580 [compost metagenome]
MLVDAHPRTIGIVLQVLQFLRDSQRRIFVEGQTEQSVTGVPRSVLEYRSLTVGLIPVYVLW